jgi:membrane-associated HD superfamily phosphohydrolase
MFFPNRIADLIEQFHGVNSLSVFYFQYKFLLGGAAVKLVQWNGVADEITQVF